MALYYNYRCPNNHNWSGGADGRVCPQCDAVVPESKSAFYEADPTLVEHPPHYTSHPSGVECLTVVEHMGFCLGNVIKYIWRADMKGGVHDLEKARFYLDREINRRKENGE